MFVVFVAGKAASIADMCITPLEFEQRLGVFLQYCPVSLALRGELVNCSSEPSLKYAAEFRGHYYKMAGPQELQVRCGSNYMYMRIQIVVNECMYALSFILNLLPTTSPC